jgi:hypothetical protein
MRTAIVQSGIFLLLIVGITGLVACQRHKKEASQERKETAESYIPSEGAVGFDILPLHSSGGAQRWLATYTDDSGTTKFSFELEAGKGKFTSEEGSNPLPLLEALKKALEAKHMPRKVEHADMLSFLYVVIGEHNSQAVGGGFNEKPSGNWTAMKIFLADGKGEVFLNFNPVLHKAEFSIKDPEYGDIVLAELAKVL